MASINKVILIGNLGNDPEVNQLPSGDPVANFTLATNRKWKNKQTGELMEEVEWHRVCAFGHSATYVERYMAKGAQVYVEGRLRTRKWTDKDGVEKYTTEVIADTVQGLGSRESGGDQRGGGGGGQREQRGGGQGYGPPTNGEGVGGRQGGQRQNKPAAYDPGGYQPTGGSSNDDDIPF